MPLNTELVFHLGCLTRLIYYVTDEDDRAITQLRDEMSRQEGKLWVFNAAFGLKPVDKYIGDWKTRAHETAAQDKMSIHDTLIQIYKDDPRNDVNVYVIQDAERWMQDVHVVRRILNIVHQGNHDIETVKVIILMGSRKIIPPSLMRYVTVIHDKGPDADDVMSVIAEACKYVKIPVPDSSEQYFKGLSLFEIKSAAAQSIVLTSSRDNNPSIDPELISGFRRQQFMKTDLVQYIETSAYDFSILGGVQRFKDWAHKTKASWSPEGRAFGLKPPKGVLGVGVWGCGKSLSVKVLGHIWNLPVVQLEMGRIRTNLVGESEANIYRVLRIIESAAPCLVWIDEGEKSLSGLASSAGSDAGVTARLIGILSTWLQETEAPVCLAITANSLTTLPVEFVNRLDERFFFDMPALNDRVDILKIHLTKAGQDLDNFSLLPLAEKAKGMVGREIEQAIGAAMIESYHQGKPHLDEDILGVVLVRKPRIAKTMGDEIKAVREWVGYDKDADDGIKARFAAKPDRTEVAWTSAD